MGSPPLAAAYRADRAAGLAGVPLSTLHYWSREGIWTPSVSPSKVKRWSYADLLGLRLIDWLRRDKPDIRIPHSSMSKIRRALSGVERFGDRLTDRSVRVLVDQRGGIILRTDEDLFVPLGPGLFQGLVDAEVDLVEAFTSRTGMRAPDLVSPRPTLRIIPGKLSGEPHVVDTRIPTTMVAALCRRGLETRQVLELYPGLTEENVLHSIQLEDQLREALHPVAA